RLITQEGRVLWLRTCVSGERATAETPAELHGFSVDVTEIKRAEEEAQAAKRARDELLAIVSHDLRDPLNSIRISAMMMSRALSETKDPELASTRDLATTVAESAERMGRLIGQLVDLSQLEAGGLHVKLRPVGVSRLVSDVQGMFHPLAAEKNI